MKASRLLIPYAISCNPIIATAIGLPIEHLWCCMPGTPAHVVNGFTLAVRNIQGLYVLDIELPPMVSTTNAQSVLTSASFPFLLVTPTHATVFVRGDTESVPLADDRFDAQAFNDLVQRMMETKRFGRWATLIEPEQPRLGEVFGGSSIMDTCELVDDWIIRSLPNSLESWTGGLALGPMKALQGVLGGHGDGIGAITVIEGPRLAVMDLALQFALDAARGPVPTLVVDALHRNVHISDRLLLVDSGEALSGRPEMALDAEFDARFCAAATKIRSLPLSMAIEDSGSIDALCETVAKWVWPPRQATDSRGAVILLDLQMVLNEPGAWMRLVRLAYMIKRLFVLTLATDQGGPPIHRPLSRHLSNWLICEPSSGGAYDIRVRSSWRLPPTSIGKFVHDPERGSWAEATNPLRSPSLE